MVNDQTPYQDCYPASTNTANTEEEWPMPIRIIDPFPNDEDQK